MVKSELAERIAAKKPRLYRRDAELIINTILDTISTALERGDRVELRDFGVFAVKMREASSGRNPAIALRLPCPRGSFQCSRPAAP